MSRGSSPLRLFLSLTLFLPGPGAVRSFAQAVQSSGIRTAPSGLPTAPVLPPVGDAAASFSLDLPSPLSESVRSPTAALPPSAGPAEISQISLLPISNLSGAILPAHTPASSEKKSPPDHAKAAADSSETREAPPAKETLEAGTRRLEEDKTPEARARTLDLIFLGSPRLSSRGFVEEAAGGEAPAVSPLLGFPAGRSEISRAEPAAPLLGAAAALPLAALAWSSPLVWTLVLAAGALAGAWLLRRSWPKLAAFVGTVRDSIAWVRSFWATMGRSGVSVKRELIVGSALALALSAISFLPPVLLGEMLQNLKDLGPGQTDALLSYFKLGGLLIGAYSLLSAANYFFFWVMTVIGNKQMWGVNNLFMRHVLHLPLHWHNNRAVGDVLSTATDAIYNVQRGSTDLVIDTIKNGALLLGSLAGMIWVSATMTAAVAPFLIFALAVPAALYGHRLDEAYRRFFSKLKPKLASLIEQVLLNVEVIKAAGKEGAELEKIDELGRQTYLGGGEQIGRAAAPHQALAGGITDAAKILVILALATLIYFDIGGLTIKAATVFFFLSNYFRDAVKGLYDGYVKLRQMKGSAAKFDRIMGQIEEDYNVGGAVLPPSDRGRAVSFRSVTFGYDEGQRVLDRVDIEMAPGRVTALVGSSGSGKSTLAKLLLGLYPLSGGSLAVDGVDLAGLDKPEFRRRVGTILQDPLPFNASIAYNIGYLRPGASESEIWRAAEEAGLHEDIVRIGYNRNLEGPKDPEENPEEARLAAVLRGKLAAAGALDPKKSILAALGGAAGASWEQAVQAARELGIHDDIVRLGYAAMVGERGVNLSGGQKQRLSLARLFVSADQPWDVLIFDEPTSALDGLTQRRVQQAIERRRGKTTVLLIAHRLSTVQGADQIVVLNAGAVVERGTHAELLERGGAYAKLWEAQRLIDEAERLRPVQSGSKEP